MIHSYHLEAATAAQLCEAACAYAQKQQWTICAWVLDSAGNPLAMQRANNAPLASTDIARNKAWTAVSFKFPTDQWQARLADKPHLLSSLNQQPGLALFGGGLPIFHDGMLVGAIGISGATEEQDQRCAHVALKTCCLASSRE